MVTTLSKRPVRSETMLYLAAVDPEFRSALIDTPEVFGMGHKAVLLPDAVERQEQESLKIWNDALAAGDVADCTTSCSWGPITVVCDGTTK